ncbi:protein MAIN-LIKE 2-like [Glycine soja]|uniref:protein MAIN-LIKE 2-like n=1 Tax=Glycine soja TaxID=3848 RepID=UPI00103E7A1D|nr:protein MAIN-LIKE 2-like [Glycine soja]
MDYVHHVAIPERPELKLSSHGRKVEKFGRPAPEIEGIMAATGLSPLIACSLDTGDRRLISAFAERWHKETSSFHLSITITLDDVTLLLHLLVIGTFHSFEALHVDQVVDLLVDLLEVNSQEAREETFQCHETYVRLSWLRYIYHSKCDVGQWTVAARAYLLHLVGCTLFANKSVTHMHVVFLDAFRDLSQTGSYAWGVVALCWIYEYFPTITSSIVAEDYHERKPRACRWKSGKALPVSTYRKRLDRLTSDVVCWIPYGDHHEFREFELISLFSRHIRWGPSIVIHRESCAPCALDYMNWFYFISHPFMSPTQLEDPPRHPPMVHDDTFIEPDPPQYPVSTVAMPEPPAAAPADVDMPRHAHEVCQAIIERLKLLINLRVVTEGTYAYTVTEECPRITRSVTMQGNVYVRSRRKWCMPDA